MGYHPRIEHPRYARFYTNRTRNCELWFINNRPLHDEILGYFAKNMQRYNGTTYGIAIHGDHIHHLSQFPDNNASRFSQVFNHCVSISTKRRTKFEGGNLFARRYSGEYVPENIDIEEYFFYIVLQPVLDGLVDNIFDYPGYNCFIDAITGRKRTWRLTDWAAYNSAERHNKNIRIEDYIYEWELEFARLPGYEDWPQEKYRQYMYRQLKERTEEIKQERKAAGKKFLGIQKVKATVPGTKAMNPKLSHRQSVRPRVLCSNPKVHHEMMTWYFEVYYQYKEASEDYRAGNLDAVFPPGTYRPPIGPIPYLPGDDF